MFRSSTIACLALAFSLSMSRSAFASLTASRAQKEGPPIEITVYAAASLREALNEIAAGYDEKNGTKIVFNFGSSGDLSKQIVAANKADLFFSADEK